MYKIKQTPEDFIVEEVDKNKKVWSIQKDYFFDSNSFGEYLWCLLIKKNWDLNKLIRILAKKLRISKKRFSFAGTKDKVAITSQLISIYNVKKEDLEKIRICDCKLIPLFYSNKRNYLGNLWGNHFIIKVYSDQKIDEIPCDFPNFYGEQRFGKYKNNHLIGKCIIKKEYKKACELILNNREIGLYEKPLFDYLKKYPNDYLGALKQLNKNVLLTYVHSYQSYLFNEFLKIVIKENLDIKYGQIFGYKSKIRNEYEKELLEMEGVSLEDFRLKDFKIKLKGDFRKCYAKVYNLKVTSFEKGYIFDFCLKKGSYATVFIDWVFSKRVDYP